MNHSFFQRCQHGGSNYIWLHSLNQLFPGCVAVVVIQLIACSTFPRKHTNLGCRTYVSWFSARHGLPRGCSWRAAHPSDTWPVPALKQRCSGSEEQLWRRSITREEQQQACQTGPQQPKKLICLLGKQQLTISCISTTSGCLLQKPTARITAHKQHMIQKNLRVKFWGLRGVQVMYTCITFHSYYVQSRLMNFFLTLWRIIWGYNTLVPCLK